ncbi:MAG: VCBS repeat-containing protein, partial [Pseudomonadota bacterium]
METSYIFDAGVARVDGDRCLDLFTVNHSRRPVTLLNRGGGAFDMLDMQAAFPEIGFQTVPTRAPPPIPGFDGIDLRVFQQGGHLVLSASPQMQGEAALIVERWAPDALRAREVALGRSALRPILARRGRFEEVPADGKARRLRVVLSPGGSAVIDATLPARPVRIRIDDGRPMARLRWTADFERQGAWIAQRRLPDIHSVASGDWDLDGVRDAFLARGGMRGSAREAEAEITDFLAQLAPGGGGTARPAPVLGFEKRGCPIRQALVTDANADGEADLHLVCARAGDVFPDQVWLRREDGGFVEAAASLGLAFAERLSARWAHLDGDGRLDVAVRRGDRLWVYLNRAEGFEGTLIAEGLRRGNVPPPAVGDYDADGDLDLLVPA